MNKPHIRIMFGNWWCFCTREEADRSAAGDRSVLGWCGGRDPSVALRRWIGYNRMKA